MGNKIGVFDSGIGGITVLNEIIKILPEEEYLYYSDSKNNPYGNKSDSEIIEICDNIVNYLVNQHCNVIVIACNTASAKAAKYLREKYKNIPIIAIEPAYKMVYDYSYKNPTLVMATEGTIKSEKFNLLYKKYNNNNTYLVPCAGLADIIEAGEIDKVKIYLKENLKKFEGKIKNVVLGCTHYPLIKKEIEDVLGKVTFFDGTPQLAKHLKTILVKIENTNKIEPGIKFVDSKNLPEKEIRFYSLLNL